jgi:two-component system, OmpR family, sensor kinase
MTLWVLVFVFGVAAVAGLVALKLLALRFTDDIDNEMRETARGMTAAMELFTDEEIREITENPTLEDVIDSPQAVIVLDGDDIEFAVKAGTSDDPEALPVLTEYTTGELRARAGEVFEMDGGGGVPDYRVLTAVLDDGRLLVVATALDDFERGLQTIGSVLFGVAIVGAVVMAVVVSFVTGYVTRPLDGMIATAQVIGSGQLDTRISTEGVDDVSRLAGALNAMLDRLETAFADKEASEAKLRQFVADASHELRTPLSAMLGYAQLVQTGMATSPDQVDHAVGRIASEGERMRMMVEELLMLARLDHGRPANPIPVDVGELARVAAGDAMAIAPDRPIALHVADGGIVVVADAASLRQAIDNLLANTRAHTPAGTRVDVTVERRDGDVAIVVDDDGPGIDPADAAQLFDRFFRAERSRARDGKPGGSGLGLSIVAAVAESHDGSVSVGSSPSGGARFTIRLPAPAP